MQGDLSHTKRLMQFRNNAVSSLAKGTTGAKVTL